jgi:hypothetical protein
MKGRYTGIKIMSVMEFGQFDRGSDIPDALVGALLMLLRKSDTEVLKFVTSSPAIRASARRRGFLSLGEGMTFKFMAPLGNPLHGDRNHNRRLALVAILRGRFHIRVTMRSKSKMTNPLKRLALVSSAAFGAPRLFKRAQPTATVVLSHKYFFPDEPKVRSIDRLRRQLEWLRRAYKPISVPELVNGLVKGIVPDNSIVATTDDALLDVYEVLEEFRSFEVPLALFVCVGWVPSDDFSEGNALIRVVNAIQWYQGPDARIRFGNRFSCDLAATRRSANIDWILNERASLLPYLEELCLKIAALDKRTHRMVCNWSELHELASSGAYIGAHSISHVPISQMSAVRRNFEIVESKHIIKSKFGSCTTFAYPYGMSGTYNSSTLAELKAAGFQAAFLSHSDFITASGPIFELPRIALPDAPMPLVEFKARVRGGGIPFRKLKATVFPDNIMT